MYLLFSRAGIALSVFTIILCGCGPRAATQNKEDLAISGLKSTIYEEAVEGCVVLHKKAVSDLSGRLLASTEGDRLFSADNGKHPLLYEMVGEFEGKISPYLRRSDGNPFASLSVRVDGLVVAVSDCGKSGVIAVHNITVIGYAQEW